MGHAYSLKLWKLKYYPGHLQHLNSWPLFFNRVSLTPHNPPSLHEPFHPCNLCSELYYFFLWMLALTARKDRRCWYLLTPCYTLILALCWVSYVHNFKKVSWSIVVWWYCVSFYCSAEWISYVYIYILFFSGFYSFLGHHSILSRVSWARQSVHVRYVFYT